MHSFYSETNGLFAEVEFNGPAEFLPSVCPEGHVPLPGRFDRLRYRVDLGTMEVVEYQPPQPPSTQSTDYSWDPLVWRWQPVPSLWALQVQRTAEVDAAIAAQEARRVRPASELLLALAAGQPLDAALVGILQETETELVRLRGLRAAVQATTTKADLAATPTP